MHWLLNLSKLCPNGIIDYTLVRMYAVVSTMVQWRKLPYLHVITVPVLNVRRLHNYLFT